MKPLFNRYFSTILISAFATFLALGGTSCKQKQSEAKAAEAIKDSIERVKNDSIAEFRKKFTPDSFPLIKYKRYAIRSQKELREILARFPKSDSSNKKAFDKSRIIRTMNRKELRYFRVGDTIIAPETIIEDVRAYSCFPNYYYEARDIPKIIIVSNKYQAYACYEYGKLTRFAAGNTGKEKSQTYPGRYAMNWRQRLRHSSIDSSWVLPWTWNIHLEAGNAFHQFDMPGRPVSHSCIRQFKEDAEWLYAWGRGAKKDSSTGRFVPFSGTPVLIIDVFDWTRKKGGPWLDSRNNRENLVLLPSNPLEYEEALIPIKQIPKSSRGVLRNKQRYITAEDTLRARGVIRPGVEITESVNYNKLRREKAAKKAKEQKAKEQKAKEYKPAFD